MSQDFKDYQNIFELKSGVSDKLFNLPKFECYCLRKLKIHYLLLEIAATAKVKS